MAAVHAAITDIWALYAIGSCLIAARLFVRVQMVGFRGLQADDYIVVWVFVSKHRPTCIYAPFRDMRDLHGRLLTKLSTYPFQSLVMS